LCLYLEVFSCGSLKVSSVTLKCFIHFEFIFIQGKKKGSRFSLLIDR
jgi:hypothetical protein